MGELGIASWVRLAWRNLFRRKLRTLITASGIAVAVAAISSMLSFQRGYQAGMSNELERLGAHILVVPKGCPYDAASIALHGASWPCYLKSAYLDQVKHTEGVATAAPLLMNATFTESGEQVVTVGATREILALKRGWNIKGSFPFKDNQVLIGDAVAKKRGLKIGESLTVPNHPKETLVVSGVIAPTQGADDNYIYSTLPMAQKMMGRPDELTHILVRLKDPNSLDAVVGGLRSCEAGMDMNIVPLSHLFRTIGSLVNSLKLLLGCIALIALIVAGAAVANTALISVSERTREIGVLRAIGASTGDVFRLIFFETTALCLVGGAAGCIGAAVISPAAEVWLRNRLPFAPTDTLASPSFGLMVTSIGLACVVGAVAALLPAWRAAQLSPALAMRTNLR